jgi:hypothetical protein
VAPGRRTPDDPLALPAIDRAERLSHNDKPHGDLGGSMSESLTPVHRETIIPEVLSALVYEDQVRLSPDGNGAIGPLAPVWVFASHGLESVGQREMVLAILRTTPGRYPQDPFALFASFYDGATGGAALSYGSIFDIQNGKPDFDPRVDGFICLNYGLDESRLPALDPALYERSPLLLLPLLPAEIQAADMFGISRVVALLAKDSACHPFPWWHDPRRPPVVAPGGSPSILAALEVPRAHTPQVEVTLTGTHLYIAVPVSECAALHARIAVIEGAFALLTGVAAEAEGRFFWEPGQEHPSVTVCGDRPELVSQLDFEVAGNFLMMGHGHVSDEAQLTEDGFVVWMTEATWHLFIAALAAQESFSWRTEDRRITEVTLELRQTTYTSPFGARYRTEAGGLVRRYGLSPGAAPSPESQELHNVEVQLIRLLSSQHEFAEATSTEGLGHYLDQACAVIDNVMAGVEHNLEEACVQFRLAPDSRPSVRLAVRPADSAAFPSQTGQVLVEKLNAVPAPAVTRHELRFEARLTFPTARQEMSPLPAETSPARPPDVDQRPADAGRRPAIPWPRRMR